MRYVAFLRAINVTGTNMVKMPALKEVFLKSGFTDVSTYLQSGNVVFSAGSVPRTALEDKIESRLASALGLSVKVLVRTKNEIEVIIKSNPFLRAGRETEFLHATIFKSKIDVEGIELQAIKKDNREEFNLTEECVFLYCPLGYGRTKLNNTNWERWLKIAATTRNWKTILAVNGLMA